MRENLLLLLVSVADRDINGLASVSDLSLPDSRVKVITLQRARARARKRRRKRKTILSTDD